MMKNIFIIFICIALVSCQTPSLNTEKQYEIKISDLVSNKKAIIIFEDFLHGVRFQNVDNMQNKIYSNPDSKGNLRIFEISSGRYFFMQGITEKPLRVSCLKSVGLHMLISMALLGLAIGDLKMFTVPSIKDSNDEYSAVIYFDIKPGEVVYVGSLNSSNVSCKFVIEDNFNDIKEKLSKTMPSIANIMQKKLMKLEKMPEVCEDLQDEWSRDVNKNKHMKKIDLYQNYPACIKALESLGQETVVNNNVK
jgi:hypothetical protein